MFDGLMTPYNKSVYKSPSAIKQCIRYIVITICIGYIAYINQLLSIDQFVTYCASHGIHHLQVTANSLMRYAGLYSTPILSSPTGPQLAVTHLLLSIPTSHICASTTSHSQWLQRAEYVAVGGQTYNPFVHTAIRLTNPDNSGITQVTNIDVTFTTGLTYDIQCSYDAVWNVGYAHPRSIKPHQDLILTHNGEIDNIVLPCALKPTDMQQSSTVQYGSIIAVTYNTGGRSVVSSYTIDRHINSTETCITSADWMSIPVGNTIEPIQSVVSKFELKVKSAGNDVTDDDIARLNSRLPITSPSFTFGELIDSRIELRRIDNFLNASICAELIEYAAPQTVPSRVVTDVSKPNKGGTHQARTSTSAYIRRAATPLIQHIEKYAADMVGGGILHVEGLQVVKYEKGQQFEPHFDWFQPSYVKQIQNQRLYTFFVYLNEVDLGGHTAFQRLNHTFTPHTGTALFWRNAQSLTGTYELALHSGTPVESDQIKYGLNIWYNFLPINHHYKRNTTS